MCWRNFPNPYLKNQNSKIFLKLGHVTLTIFGQIFYFLFTYFFIFEERIIATNK